MACYTLHDVSLAVHAEPTELETELAQLLEDLSFVRTPSLQKTPSLHLSLSHRDHGLCLPLYARVVFQAEGFCGLESEEDFYLTDGAAMLHLSPNRGYGEGQVATSFFAQPVSLRRTFWTFGLLKLLRPLGFYSLHAAGVVSPTGEGLLLVGSSGSGKSTLTVGLIRQGWGYLSDDAVLLQAQPEGVEALALRKYVYVDAEAVSQYLALPLGEAVPDARGRPRRRVCVEAAYPGQYAARCVPHILLFARIVSRPQSSLRPLERLSALRQLLAASGPQLFDRGTTAQQLEILKRLVQQTASYELEAGRDLYARPDTLVHLLTQIEGTRPWRASLSN
jgi:hypothetical protein